MHRYLALIAAQTRLVVSSGNHDLTGPDDGGEQSALWLHDVPHGEILTDGDALVLEDTRITVCPWWDGPLGRAEVVSQLVADAARRPDTWVWLYHWPPLGSPTCWTGRRDYGDADLRGWIEEFQPEIVLAGHVHEAPFKSDGSWVDRIGHTWVLQRGPPDRPGPGVRGARSRPSTSHVEVHHGDRVGRPERDRCTGPHGLLTR